MYEQSKDLSENGLMQSARAGEGKTFFLQLSTVRCRVLGACEHACVRTETQQLRYSLCHANVSACVKECMWFGMCGCECA